MALTCQLRTSWRPSVTSVLIGGQLLLNIQPSFPSPRAEAIPDSDYADRMHGYSSDSELPYDGAAFSVSYAFNSATWMSVDGPRELVLETQSRCLSRYNGLVSMRNTARQ